MHTAPGATLWGGHGRDQRGLQDSLPLVLTGQAKGLPDPSESSLYAIVGEYQPVVDGRMGGLHGGGTA